MTNAAEQFMASVMDSGLEANEEWEQLDVHAHGMAPGESIIGVLESIEAYEETFIYTFNTADGTVEKLYGSYQLDKVIKPEHVGQKHKILFKGMVNLPHGRTVKRYNIFRAKGPANEQPKSTKKASKTSS